MSYLLLALTLFCSALQNVLVKVYDRKNEGRPFVILFNALRTLTALLLFTVIVLIKGFNFHLPTLIYAAVYSVSLSSALVFIHLALSHGSLSLTGLITSYSLLIPVFYGILFLGETINTFMVLGLVFFAVSMFFVNFKSKSGEKFNFKWLLFIILSFITNGASATIQKMHQINYPSMYQSEFMFIGMGIAAVIFFMLSIRHRGYVKPLFKSNWYVGALGGVCLGVVNYMVLVLAATLPSSVMFPVISAGSIVLLSIVSVVVYKEKLSVPQIFGLIIGVCSIIFLNL